ncbi:hypothetical protein QBC35DRAFT_379576 [Podospora australis]|uniref:Uncharacterized protein n=1 Tax=Podospora australis TaxID=1536484 RepID=A0AAN7AJR8_9PEZI|nr:hypothetical protein QBC35DRAFT_379576 [Podospora australis]
MDTFIPGLTQKPFPGISLSAGGLLALADLKTISQRTALTGGASWLDTLLLAPGLHYQQAEGGSLAIAGMVDENGGHPVNLRLNNTATAKYIESVAKPGETVTLDIEGYKLERSATGLNATAWLEHKGARLGWASHILYLMGPLLTCSALVFIIVFKDWWCLANVIALMISRFLNVWVIKQRTIPRNRIDDSGRHRSFSSSSSSSGRSWSRSLSRGAEYIANYVVSLGDGRTVVRLRGSVRDLRAVTQVTWLRSKTHVEGYIEAFAKLIVYMVASLSGNMTQVGNLVLMVLLLVSAGLLALSNHKAKRFMVNGRAAVVHPAANKKNDNENKAAASSSESLPEQRGRRQEGTVATAAALSRTGSTDRGSSTSGSVSSDGRTLVGNGADLAERGQAGELRIKWQDQQKPR